MALNLNITDKVSHLRESIKKDYLLANVGSFELYIADFHVSPFFNNLLIISLIESFNCSQFETIHSKGRIYLKDFKYIKFLMM